MTAPFPLPADPMWHDIVEQLPVRGLIVDRDGTILWINRRWRNDIGEMRDGSTWPDHVIADDRAAVAAAWRTHDGRTGPFVASVTLTTRAGSSDATLTLRALSAGDDAVSHWIGIATDDAGPRVDTAHAATQAELDTLTNAMPQMVWATRPDGHHDFYNRQWYRYTGVPDGSTDGEGWNDMFHPDDRERAWARWRHSLDTGEPYEIEYRLRHRSGGYRWVLGRALPVRGPDGTIVRWIGTCTDIDTAKRNAEQNEILSRELSHRIKNIFAVISGLVRMSARRTPAMRGFADELAGRISALGMAHDLARPHSERSRPFVGDATLHVVLRELLSPYDAVQWSVAGDDIRIDDRGATPVALVFHELATNAAKYGALSVPAGRVAVQTARTRDGLTIEWCESGGPPVGAEPDVTGFGTRLAALSIEQQLGGTIARDWHRDGLVVRITVPPRALARD